MEIIPITLLTIFAAAVGTMSGFGVSTIMVPILLLYLPLLDTLLLVAVIHAANDLWKILLFRSGFNWRLILFFGVPGIFMSYFGATLVVNVASGERGLFYLGIFLIVYVFFLIINPRFRLPQKPATSVLGGALYGLSAGFFGIGGEIRAAFLSVFNLEKTVYIFTNGALGIFVNLTRAGTYFYNTVPDKQLLSGLIFFIPASFLGALIGRRIVNHIPQNKFRFVIIALLFLVALRLLWM